MSMRITIDFKLDNSVDIHMTEAIQLPEWARYAAVTIPTIVAGAVTMQFIHQADVTTALLLASNDTSWENVEVAIDSVGALTTVMASGSDPTVVDISRFIRGLGDGYIRFNAAGNQSAVTSWRIGFTD